MGCGASKALIAVSKGKDDEATVAMVSKLSLAADSIARTAARNGCIAVCAALFKQHGVQRGLVLAVLLGVSDPTPAARHKDRDARRTAIVDGLFKCSLETRSTAVVRAALSDIAADGQPTLHRAASNNLLKVVLALVSGGVDMLQPNAKGQSAADVAFAHTHHKVASALEALLVLGEEGGGIVVGSQVFPVHDTTASAGAGAAAAGAGGEGDALEIRNPLQLEASYRAFSTAVSIVVDKSEDVSATATLLRVPDDTAKALLAQHGFDQRALLHKFFRDPKACCEAAHVPLPRSASSSAAPVVAEAVEDDCCAICFDDVTEPGLCLLCRHAFCRDCWKGYLSSTIGDKGDLVCPAYNCNMQLTEDLVGAVDGELVAPFRTAEATMHVDSRLNIKWCPVADCSRAVRYDKDRGRDVTCQSSHVWCWSCLKVGGHEPASCVAWKMWSHKKMSPEEAATQKLLMENTKPCPKCHAAIEKNGGCRHMRCRSCKHEFCWDCMEEWFNHRTARHANCKNTFVKKGAEDRGSAEAWAKHGAGIPLSGKRGLFTRRFLQHMDNAALDRENHKAFLRKALELQASTAVTVDLSFLKDCTSVLVAAHTALANATVQEFSMADDKLETTKLRMLALTLDTATEELSFMVNGSLAERQAAPRHLRVRKAALVAATASVRRALDALMDASRVNFAEQAGTKAAPPLRHVPRVCPPSGSKWKSILFFRKPSEGVASLDLEHTIDGVCVTFTGGPPVEPAQQWATMCVGATVSSGRYYFEVDYVGGVASVGWLQSSVIPASTTAATRVKGLADGIGGDARGWALNLSTGQVWHDGCTPQVVDGIRPGVTVGCGVDMSLGVLRWSVDGRWSETVVLLGDEAAPPAAGAGGDAAAMEAAAPPKLSLCPAWSTLSAPLSAVPSARGKQATLKFGSHWGVLRAPLPPKYRPLCDAYF